MYRAMAHGHPVVNGYSGHAPPHYAVLLQAVEANETDALDALAALASRGLRHLVVRVDDEGGSEWRDLVRRYPGAALVATSADQWHYVLPAPATARVAGEVGRPLSVARVDASVTPDEVPALFDGDLATRWSTGGPQRGGETLSIYLGAVRRVSAIEMALGAFPLDSPRGLAVEGSLDGEGWTAIWSGRPGALSILATIDDPSRLPLRVEFPPVETRFVRVRQTGSDPVFYWSVAELAVLGAPPGPAPSAR